MSLVPPKPYVLPATIVSVSVAVPPELSMPPPPGYAAELPEIVEPVTVSSPLLKMPPP